MTTKGASTSGALEDDGTSERASEIAADWIARAWFRRTRKEGGNGGQLMLDLAENARSHVTPKQWKEMGGP